MNWRVTTALLRSAWRETEIAAMLDHGMYRPNWHDGEACRIFDMYLDAYKERGLDLIQHYMKHS